VSERVARRSRTPRYGRVLRLVLAVAVGGTIGAPFAAAGPGGSSGPGLCGYDRGGWESIDVPFPVGSQSIKSWSISQTTIPMFATNGLAVMRSRDRGCSWQEVWRLDEVPDPGATVTSVESVIEQVHVSESPLAPGKVFLTVDQLEPVSRPRVFVSDDSGDSWSPSERGLEGAVGRPEEIATSRSNPGRVFLLTDTTGIQRSLLPDGLPDELSAAKGVAQVLYESIDGGRTWQPTQAVYSGDPWNGIEVDPVDADQVWLYGDTGAALATEITSAQQPRPVPGPIGYVDVWHQPGQPARVLATTADTAEVYRSNTGGREFVANPLPGIAQSVVGLGPVQEVYATSTGVYLVTLGRRTVDQSPTDGRPILDLYLTDGAGTELWGRSDSTIERRVFRQPTSGKFDLCKEAALLGFTPPGCAPDLDVEIPCVEAPKPGETALQPKRVELALEPGQKKTVHYDFKVPTRGQLLDVFFLIDVSGSMQDAIDGTGRAMKDIVSSLRNKGINVQFGVGEYRSYTNPPVYRRVLDITNDCGAVEEALESLIASGGGDETQLEALYQVARGESRPGVNVVVPAGQDATFRAASTRIIIHTTDEPITEGPPNPSYDEVADALNTEQIDQVGVAIEDGFGSGGGLGDRPPPSEGLERVASDTQTFAPEGGVDCNGDGEPEILQGEPLVCKISPLRARSASAMAPAITNMVEARIPDPKVRFSATPNSPVVLDGPPTGLVEDITDPAQMAFDVTYQCPQLHSRKRFTTEITATVDGEEGAVATASVLCKVPPKPEPKPPLPFVALPIVPFLPPPPAPPEIPPAPNPNPNPQPNPQSQAQAQAQAAMAHQEQQQPQLAYVHAQAQRAAAAAQESAGGRETEYAMSSYSKDSDGVPPEAIFMIGAMTMSAAFGCLTLAREKVRVQHVRR
jgi:hypothetical protein